MCGYGGMADTLASGANGSNTVQVQVLLSAPFLFLKLYRDVAQFGSVFREAPPAAEEASEKWRSGRNFNSVHRKCKLRSSALNKVVIKSRFTKT